MDNGLIPDDIREFRRALQSFDKKWQAAARAFIEGKFTTPKQFVCSGKFLKLGFAPSRDHAATLTFAIKFYTEDAKYRRNVESSAVAAIGKYGGSIKPLYSPSKSRNSRDSYGAEISFDDCSVPKLVDVSRSDDSSSASSSRLSDATPEELLESAKARLYTVSTRYREICTERTDFARMLFCELSMDRPDRNFVDSMMFFIFAIIPLVFFAKLRWMLAYVLPIEASPVKTVIQSPENIEDEWNEIRANALMLDD